MDLQLDDESGMNNEVKESEKSSSHDVDQPVLQLAFTRVLWAFSSRSFTDRELDCLRNQQD